MEDFIGRTDAATRTAKDAVCVAICDDEAFMLDLLEEKVKKMLPSAAAERFSSGRELLEGNTKRQSKIALHEGWQTSGSLKVVRMAFNLYCNGTPSVFDYDDAEEQVDECRRYTVEECISD